MSPRWQRGEQPRNLADSGPDRLLRLAAATVRDGRPVRLPGTARQGPRRPSPSARSPGRGQPPAAQPEGDPGRFRARFPALAPLPHRPRLDDLIAEAGLDLRYDESHERVYRFPPGPTDRHTRLPASVTGPGRPAGPVCGGRVGHRLTESASACSFLALGVDGIDSTAPSDALISVFGAANGRHAGADRGDAEQAASAGLPWDWFGRPTRLPGQQGIARTCRPCAAQPAGFDAAIDERSPRPLSATRPVLLTESRRSPVRPPEPAGPRADLATRRPQAIWV